MKLKLIQIIFFFGFTTFPFTSVLAANYNSIFFDKKGNPTKNNFSLVPKSSLVSCSICHSRSTLSHSDLYREPCGHGYHISCLHKAFVSNSISETYKNCEECSSFNNYTAFLLHLIFIAPEFHEGITCAPYYSNMQNIMSFWGKAMMLPNTEALQRLIKIKMPMLHYVTQSGKMIDLIILAAEKATPENLNFLLDSGLKLCSDESQTVSKGFLFAIKTANLANAAVFLERGANIDEINLDDQRISMLSTVITMGKIDSVKFLIDNNADLDLASWNGAMVPIHIAVMYDNAAIVELLIKSKRVNLSVMNKQRRTPVQSAACLGKMNALRALIDNGAPTYVFTGEGYSLLQYTIAAGPLESVKFLIDRGFMPVTKDGILSYVLHLAISPQSSETVKYLLGYGASPYEPMLTYILTFVRNSFPKYANKLAQTDPPIVIAIFKGDFETFKALLEAGMNPNTRIFGGSSSLLHLVCELGNVDMAVHLISMGADTHALDSDSRSPFYYNDDTFFNAVVYVY